MIKLDGYQKDAVLKMKSGSILCGKVGSGKSRTALAYYYGIECKGSLKNGIPGEMKDPKSLYIITTARKRDDKEWEDECEPFNLKTEVVIDSWNNIKKYVTVENAFFIFDEQRVVGYGAWVKAFLKITAKNHWILLSATPGDRWSDYIPVFIANGFYKNKYQFESRHAVYDRYSKYPKIDRYLDTKTLLKHRNDILVEMDYRNDNTRHVETILVDYDRVLYKTVWAKRWDIYNDKPIKNISQLFFTIRRLVNSDESRSDAVLQLVSDKGKAIIFYNFDFELEILRNLPYEDGTMVAEYNGKKHEPIPDSDRWVYLVQYASGSEAWNCTKTDTIIFYSLNYSYRVMEQSSGRIDRRNTPYKDLYYYYIRSSSPIDLGINRALKMKKNFNEKKFLGD